MTRTSLALGLSAVLLAAGCGRAAENDPNVWPDFEDLTVQDSVQVPDEVATPQGDGTAECAPGLTLAYVGPRSTTSKAVKLAVEQHDNANPGCQVDFASFPVAATAKALADASVIGAVGPTTSEDARATGAKFEEAGLIHISPSATSTDLTTHGWKTFQRGVGNDDVQGPSAAVLAKKLGASKVFVVNDSTAYGKGVGLTATEALGAMLIGHATVAPGRPNFAHQVTRVLKRQAHAVVYAGSDVDAARLARQLHARGFKGRFIASDHAMTPTFVKRAGKAAETSSFTCLCMPADLVGDFADAYRTSSHSTPGAYSIEAYDAAIVLLKGIDAGSTTRGKLRAFVESYSGQGYATTYRWNAAGELADTPVYGYTVDQGQIVSVGKLK